MACRSESSHSEIGNLKCPICFSRYSEDIVPRMLNCGHTHCSTCIERIIASSSGRRCGECRAIIKRRRVYDIPINYAILRLCDSQKIQVDDSIFVEFQVLIDKIDSKKNIIELEKNMLLKNIDINMAKISRLESFQRELDEQKKGIKEKSDNITKLRSMREIVTEIKKAEKFISNTPLLNLHKYNEEEFKNLLSNPSTYFAKFGHQTYSPIEIVKNKIYVKSIGHARHNLSSDQYAIKFPDFFRYVVGGYMKVSCRKLEETLEFEVNSNTLLGKQFLLLCSGEKGPSFTNCIFFNPCRSTMEGESIFCGDYEYNDGRGGRSIMLQEAADNQGKNRPATGKVPITSGMLVGQDPDIQHMGSVFEVYLEAWPSVETQRAFGQLLTGSWILKLCAFKCSDPNPVVVNECGLIVDTTKSIM